MGLKTALASLLVGTLALSGCDGGGNDKNNMNRDNDNNSGANFQNFVSYGVNLPWIDYGWDLGRNPWNGTASGFACSAKRAMLEEDFDYMQSKNVRLCRAFLFCDFRTGIQYDSDGNITGIDDCVYNDMSALIDVAKSHNIKIMPVLMDYLVANGKDEGGFRDHPEFITSKKHQLLENVIRPFVSAFRDEEAIYAWDIINEPRFASAVSRADVASFIRDCSQVIKSESPNKPVTFGSYDRYHLDELGEDACDLIEIHHYDHMANYWNYNTPASTISGKPVLFGEMQPTNTREKLNAAKSQGYGGILFWSLNANDGYDFRAIADDFSSWMNENYPID